MLLLIAFTVAIILFSFADSSICASTAALYCYILLNYFICRKGKSMSSKQFGGWTSPVSAAMVASGALRLNEPMYGDDGQTLFFLEGRPTEAGRQVLVSRQKGELVDVTPSTVNIRTLVQ